MLGGAKKNRGGVMLGGVMLGGANKWIEFLKEVKGQKFESKDKKKTAYEIWLKKDKKPKVSRKSQRVFLDDEPVVEEVKPKKLVKKVKEEDLIDLNYEPSFSDEMMAMYDTKQKGSEEEKKQLNRKTTIDMFKDRLFNTYARKPLYEYTDNELEDFDNTITRIGSGNKWIEFLKEKKGQKFESKKKKKDAYEEWMKKGMKPKRKVPESLVKKAQNPRAYDKYDVRKRLFNKSSPKPLSQYTKKEQKALNKLLKSLGSGMKMKGGEWYNDLLDVVKTVAPVVLPLLI